MGNEQTEQATSTWATVAIATGAIAFKQAVVDGHPIEFVDVLSGAGLVLGYLAWRRRQGDPGFRPERLAQSGPVSGRVALLPAVAAIVVGVFCLVHWFFALALLIGGVSLVNKRAKAGRDGEGTPPSLSRVLGELLIVDGGTPKPAPSKPSLPTPTPRVREAAPKPVAEAPRAVVADAPSPVAEVSPPPAPWGTTGPLLTMPSTLGTSLPLTLESRLPSILETRIAPSTDSIGLSGSTNGFDEALALLQGKQASMDRVD